MLGALNRLETDEGDLHRQDGAKRVDSAVGDVDAMWEAARQDQRQHVQRNQIDEEDVATPRRHLYQTNNEIEIMSRFQH